MLRFFRRLRQNDLTAGNLGRYLIYAVGEIGLVVVGILLALQIDNWNDERKQEKQFRFDLKHLHQELTVDLQNGLSKHEAYIFQLDLIERLRTNPGDIPKDHLPGILQVLDVNLLTTVGSKSNEKFRQSLIKFNPDNDFQNTLSSRLLKYMQDVRDVESYTDLLEEEESLNSLPVMANYLRACKIPLRKYGAGTRFSDFIRYKHEFSISSKGEIGYEISHAQYDEASLEKLFGMLSDSLFLSDLNELWHVKGLSAATLDMHDAAIKQLLKTIESYAPEAILQHKQLFVVGTGTQFKNWNDNIPMEPKDEEGYVWEALLPLNEGHIKFRTDDLWTLNWGIGHSTDKQLMFNGPNIQVDEGVHRIKVNLRDNTYSISPLEKQ